MKKPRARTIVLVMGLACILLLMFNGQIVFGVYNVLHKPAVQKNFDTANTELEYPFAFLGVRDNRGPAYLAPVHCFHSGPPRVFNEEVGCSAAIHVEKSFRDEQDTVAKKAEIDAWVDGLGKRLEQHEWQPEPYPNDAGDDIYSLKEEGSHSVRYKKRVGSTTCTLMLSSNTVVRTNDQPVSGLPYIIGDLLCRRTTTLLL